MIRDEKNVQGDGQMFYDVRTIYYMETGDCRVFVFLISFSTRLVDFKHRHIHVDRFGHVDLDFVRHRRPNRSITTRLGNCTRIIKQMRSV